MMESRSLGTRDSMTAGVQQSRDCEGAVSVSMSFTSKETAAAQARLRISSPVTTLILIFGALVLSGCAYSESRTTTTTEVFGGEGMLMTQTMTAGQSVRGRAIPVHVLGIGGAGGTVLIIAGIHGDESAGVPLVAMLEAHIEANPEIVRDRQVVIIPRANPDGLAGRSRTNHHGVDLNRNFPADNFDASGPNGYKPLSEPEARVIHRMIELYRPSLIISIHQPLNCIDYDGPARAIAERMARTCDLPVRKLGTRPGSLGAFAGETLGIPIITVELPRDAHRLSDAELWAAYGEMMLAGIH